MGLLLLILLVYTYCACTARWEAGSFEALLAEAPKQTTLPNPGGWPNSQDDVVVRIRRIGHARFSEGLKALKS